MPLSVSRRRTSMPWAAKKARARSSEGRRACRALVCELLGVGQTSGVVDGHVHEVPADAAVPAAALGKAPAAALPDTPQALRVEVHEVAGDRPAVAHG